MILSYDETVQIKEHGLTVEEVKRQIELIENGVKYPELVKPAVIGDGIKKFSEDEIDEFVEYWENNSNELNIHKFVPASGAATRMFKSLNFILHNFDKLTFGELKKNAKENPEFNKAKIFLENLEKFPFFEDIFPFEKPSSDDEDVIPLISFLLEPHGLNFADTPKALIKFHKYGKDFRTPIDEHVYEAIKLFDKDNLRSIIFTISPKYEERFQDYFSEVFSRFKNESLVLGISDQEPSTDTIVLDNGSLLKDENGKIIFRPGGHGALLENINKIFPHMIFIKNIDNVAKEAHANKTIRYRKFLGGYLLFLFDEISTILSAIENDEITKEELTEAIEFAEKDLNVILSKEVKSKSFTELKKLLFRKLNKPIRVAAMVKNTGEPGGGPFWVKNDDGSLNLQIIEKAQINTEDENQLNILKKATHFNPVDMVCFLRDYKYNKFDLKKFVNEEYGIITEKHLLGKDVKVLERPGLWNASMWDWITVFVDVPLFTFTPVKEVNDLLKPEHN